MNLNQQALHKINILLQKLAEDIFEQGSTQLTQYSKMTDEVEEIINAMVEPM